MEIKDLVEGEIYTSDINNNGTKYIYRIINKVGGYDAMLYNKTFYFNKVNIYDLFTNIKLATFEEKHWLNKCIEANKFIEYEEAIKTFKKEEIFCIELESQNHLDEIISFYKEKGYKEFGNSHTYKNGYVICINPNKKEWQTYIENSRKYPIKEFKKNYKGEAVNCTSEEELKFVKKTLNIDFPIWKYNKEKTCIIFNKERFTHSDLDYLKNDNFKIYSFQEWCDMFGHKPDFKPNFEIGKWYKISNNWYAKFNMIHGQNTYWQYTESITYKGVYEKMSHNLKMSDINSGIKIELLTDLSEIQQYLPDGHSDKKIKYQKLLSEHIQVGTVYYKKGYCTPENPRTIVKIDGTKFYYNNHYGSYNTLLELKNNNFCLISLPNKVEDNIPKYIECITGFDNYIIPKVIYYVKDSSNKKSLELISNIEIGNFSPGSLLYVGIDEFTFKSSTEKEYLEQQKQIEMKEEFNIGDWVICINAKDQSYPIEIENKPFKILEIKTAKLGKYVTGFAQKYPELMKTEGGIYFYNLKKVFQHEISNQNIQSDEDNITLFDQIEVGDEVMTPHGSGILIAIIDMNCGYLVKNNKYPAHTGNPKFYKNLLLKGNFSDKNDSWYYNLSQLKLIKKASNTTINKKDDFVSPQVHNNITNIIIPKKVSVTFKNTEHEIKIKINNLKTIKI